MRSFNYTLGKWETVTDYTYNANNQLTESTTKVNNDLTEINRYYYNENGNTTAEQKKTYTANGNISSDMSISGRSESGSTKIYSYDYFNRLIGYNDGKTTAEYTYG